MRLWFCVSRKTLISGKFPPSLLAFDGPFFNALSIEGLMGSVLVKYLTFNFFNSPLKIYLLLVLLHFCHNYFQFLNLPLIAGRLFFCVLIQSTLSNSQLLCYFSHRQPVLNQNLCAFQNFRIYRFSSFESSSFLCFCNSSLLSFENQRTFKLRNGSQQMKQQHRYRILFPCLG